MIISLPEQLKAARRELGKREKHYPEWVRCGRMSDEKARYEIECMKAIIKTLDTQLDLFEVSEEMKRGSSGQGQPLG